ncbi:MAG TPA: hypothetical protein VFP30_00460, partial [Candidatus Limnocylindria bacterium]|nr:hypothetical protein [Candidatus Limnocylindria bacterium]
MKRQAVALLRHATVAGCLDLDEIVVLARRASEFELAARLDGASWVDGRLVLDFQAELDRRGDASPLTIRQRDGAVLLDPAVADDLVGPIDVSDELGSV